VRLVVRGEPALAPQHRPKPTAHRGDGFAREFVERAEMAVERVRIESCLARELAQAEARETAAAGRQPQRGFDQLALAGRQLGAGDGRCCGDGGHRAFNHRAVYASNSCTLNDLDAMCTVVYPAR
jgi:hypothetical protein